MIAAIGEGFEALDRINQIMATFGGGSIGPTPLGASGTTRTFAMELTAQDLATAGVAPTVSAASSGGYPLAQAGDTTIGRCSDCGSIHVIPAADAAGSPSVSATAAAPSAVAVSSPLDWSGTGDEVPPGTPYGELFTQAGRAHGVSPKLLAAVAEVESNYRTDAVSPVGAQGLMQFMPQTAAGFGVDPWNPASAIDGAARYLRQLTDRFGSVDVALAAYNVGPGTVARAGGSVPSAAQRYVDKVLARANGGVR